MGGCYFDATLNKCAKNPNDKCVGKSTTECTAANGCYQFSNGCGEFGCERYGNKQDSCANDPACKFLGSTCVSRLCGYDSDESCNRDEACAWDEATKRCKPASCYGHGDNELECKADKACVFDPRLSPKCQINQCLVILEAMCTGNQKCIWDNTAKCEYNLCPGMTQKDCTADNNQNGKCKWAGVETGCVKAQCYFTKETECTATVNNDKCKWISYTDSDTGRLVEKCTTKSIDELIRAAAETATQATCTMVTKNFTGLMVAMIILLLLLAGLLGWMWYRQDMMQGQKKVSAKDLYQQSGEDDFGGDGLDGEQDYSAPANPIDEL
jgi:hypothetical protein